LIGLGGGFFCAFFFRGEEMKLNIPKVRKFLREVDPDKLCHRGGWFDFHDNP